MAAKTDKFIEDTARYTKTVQELSKGRNGLDDNVVASLLELVKGIDQLLTKQEGGSETKEKSKSVNKEKDSKKAEKNGKQAKVIEFDIGTHLPRNFSHQIIPLNEKNCPGLMEVREDYKPVPTVQKKRK